MDCSDYYNAGVDYFVKIKMEFRSNIKVNHNNGFEEATYKPVIYSGIDSVVLYL